jgi:hypothetical protein
MFLFCRVFFARTGIHFAQKRSNIPRLRDQYWPDIGYCATTPSAALSSLNAAANSARV